MDAVLEKPVAHNRASGQGAHEPEQGAHEPAATSAQDSTFQPVGVRDAKNNFSALTTEVNKTGKPLTVYKNNKPWVVIQPADAEAEERRKRLENFKRLTWLIENEPLKVRASWDANLSDEELLDKERMRRFG